jgi:hypothetical protein
VSHSSMSAAEFGARITFARSARSGSAGQPAFLRTRDNQVLLLEYGGGDTNPVLQGNLSGSQMTSGCHRYQRKEACDAC